jgi:AcrR family transcriptional regulator
MSERTSAGEAGGLPRLPPGRHGLPPEFVAENQRGRISAGMIAATVECGYHDASVARVVAAGGLSRATFYRFYTDKHDAFAAVYAEVTGVLLGAMADARDAERGGWAAKVRAQLGALLACFEANPDLARFCLLVPPRAGGEIAAGFRDFLPMLVGQLIEGRPKRTRRPPPVTVYFLGGGLAALICGAVDEGGAEALPPLLPDLVGWVLAPYLGREAAAAAAG